MLTDRKLKGLKPQESLTLGRYGPNGITLFRARELGMEARKEVREGRSPMIDKQRAKAKLQAARTFGEFAGEWLENGRMADSTRTMVGASTSVTSPRRELGSMMLTIIAASWGAAVSGMRG
jgi:hypothetical protein